MKKNRSLLAIVAAVALITPVFAGEGEGEKCSYETQTCLNYMADHLKTQPYIGIDLDYDENGGATVSEVTPQGPAQAAGFKVGDRLVTINGVDFSDKEALHAEWTGLKAGQQASVKVERNGAIRKLAVTLAVMPDEVIARQVGTHMLEHATVDITQD